MSRCCRRGGCSPRSSSSSARSPSAREPGWRATRTSCFRFARWVCSPCRICPGCPIECPSFVQPPGPARYLLWLVVFWLIACRGLGTCGGACGVVLSPLVIFLASAIIFGTVAWRLTATPLFPSGDEPHYLVITQSLLHDGDLRIEDNHQREEYRAYLNGPLKPDYLTRGDDGQIYSIHPVGLPVLAMPAFALGGYRGVVAMLVVMAALAAALLWQWARDITGSAPAATFGVGGCGADGSLSLQLVHGVPGDSGRAGGDGGRRLAARVDGDRRDAVARRCDRRAAVAQHEVRADGRRGDDRPAAPRAAGIRRAAAALLAPIALALAGWFAFFFWIWGTVSPSAPYGSSEPMTLGSSGARATGSALRSGVRGRRLRARPGRRVRRAGADASLGWRRSAPGAGTDVHLRRAALHRRRLPHVVGRQASPGRPVASGVLLLGVPIASLYASTASRPSARAGCHVLLAVEPRDRVALCRGTGRRARSTTTATAAPRCSSGLSPTWPLVVRLPELYRRFAGRGDLDGRSRGWRWERWSSGLVQRSDHVGLARRAGDAGAGVRRRRGARVARHQIRHRCRRRWRRRHAPACRCWMASTRRVVPTAILYDPLSRISSADALSRVYCWSRAPACARRRSRSIFCGMRASRCRQVNIACV